VSASMAGLEPTVKLTLMIAPRDYASMAARVTTALDRTSASVRLEKPVYVYHTLVVSHCVRQMWKNLGFLEKKFLCFLIF